jgi:phosphohistidine swiveling domain-containing protein
MLIIPFTTMDADLSNAGGKGLNLARLTLAGFPVPPGFIISTDAYRAFVESNQLQGAINPIVAVLADDDPSDLESASSKIRGAFSAGEIPPEIEIIIREAYRDLKEVPVAVRSSATTEDLPDLSFAGQQDTFLNIINEEELIKAVVDSWSSLWTARAIGYRARNNINHSEAALAVVVQELVQSDVFGVLFTANPLTGRLNESVIDATFGLGEALVSGQVEPDHYVVDSISGVIVDQTIGEKNVATRIRAGGGVEAIEGVAMTESCLSDEEIEQLVVLGAKVQEEYGIPQDIEWAFTDGELTLLQSRPITSLYPVPEVSFDPLIVWLSLGSIQGMVGPMTPLGRDVLQYLAAGAGSMFNLELDPEELKIFQSSGERIWVRISDLIRHPIGGRIAGPIFNFIEPSVGLILSQLASESSLGAATGKLKLRTMARLARFGIPVVFKLVRNALHPTHVRTAFEALINEKVAKIQIASGEDRFSQLANITEMIRVDIASAFSFLLPQFIPVLGPGMGALNLLNKIAGDKRALVLEVMRALPGNVTSEMDLALWATAVEIREDPESQRAIQSSDRSKLESDYKAGSLPPIARDAIARFVALYGMRGLGEIDLGQPRWREDPNSILHTLQSYLSMDPDIAPDALIARGEETALAAIEELVSIARAQPMGRLKAKVVRAASRRIRLLVGSRESPKLYIIRLMGIARQALLEVGEAFVEAGAITQPDDLVYLTMSELDALSQDEKLDWNAIVVKRRAAYVFEHRRRQVPRVLVSDGRAFYEGLGAVTQTDNIIVGSPVSPGVVEGIVRVVLDARGAKLEPGEILVCPGTDPAWTPLLMTASGLITEVGGLMTHGSVVAREFGIPAVVGIDQATMRLNDGQRIRLDGATGEIVLVLE